MVTLLAKIFIRDHENVTDSGVRQAYGILCGIVGICFNLILFTTKALAGLFSHSIAITADAFNNLSDAASSIITLVGFRMAGQKPDSDHPFGHGRIEYISGLLVSILIVLMGFELVKSSVSKIFHPEAPDYSPVIIGILIFSILVKCYMALYNRRIGTRISSVALMLQIIVVYFAPFYVFRMHVGTGYRFPAVIVAFVINYAAYFAEIYRAGIESIPVGQYEAAQVLGYSKAQTFVKIILPQVVKRVLPPVTNETITLVKDTSMAFTISIAEMFTVAKQIGAAQTSVVPLLAAGVFYYIFNLVVASFMEYLEKKTSYYR